MEHYAYGGTLFQGSMKSNNWGKKDGKKEKKKKEREKMMRPAKGRLMSKP